MSDKFQNKYRIASARYPHHDYDAGAYFVTICTQCMQHYFGQISDAEMKLSPIGKLVDEEWNKTLDIRPDMDLFIDEYVIMQNHFHAIIIIGENKNNTADGCRDAMHCVSTTDRNKFAPQSKNLPSIIRGFKSAVTKRARLINPNFTWQSRYYDHIIRTQKEMNQIADYIQNNVVNWELDKYH